MAHVVPTHLDEVVGERGKEFRCRALTGEEVVISSEADLVQVGWSALVNFVLDGQQFGFSAAPTTLDDVDLEALGLTISRSLSFRGGELRYGRQSFDAGAGIEQSGAIGIWRAGGFDLCVLSPSWDVAEDVLLDQLAAFDLDATPSGIVVRPRAERRIRMFASTINATVAPLGDLRIFSAGEARAGLVPRVAGAPTTHGTLHRLEQLEAHGGAIEELLFLTPSAVTVVSDPYVKELNEPSRLEAIETLDVRWGG